jgi:hypothetical protein
VRGEDADFCRNDLESSDSRERLRIFLRLLLRVKLANIVDTKRVAQDEPP